VSGRRLWLVRHGETEGQSSIRFHGRNDVPLSDVGRAQIRALAPLLDGVAFARIVHSPLQRAAESAAILAELCGQDPSLLGVEERLREISFGACEGMTREEIHNAFPAFWAQHQAGDIEGFPEGEKRVDFTARVASFAHEVVAEPWLGDLLVVSHRGTVRQMLRALLAMPPEAKDSFAVDLASVTVLHQAVLHAQPALPGGGWQLELLGALP
jgi:broad specificity phosphatase PhoE